MRNTWASPLISHSTGKCNMRNWYPCMMRNWYWYFSYSMGAFFPVDFHPMLDFFL